MPTSIRNLLRPVIVAIVAVAGATFAESDVALAQTFTVNTGGNDFDGTCAPLNINTGTDCTLRDAIDDANANVGADTIAFASYLSIISPASLLVRAGTPCALPPDAAHGEPTFAPGL